MTVDWGWLASINLWQVALVIIALILIIRGLVHALPWLRRAIALVDSLSGLPEFIEKTDKRLDEIHHEVHYNNGSSIKDAVRRVETGVKGLHTKVGDLEETVTEHIDQSKGWKTRLDRLEDTIPKPPKKESQ